MFGTQSGINSVISAKGKMVLVAKALLGIVLAVAVLLVVVALTLFVEYKVEQRIVPVTGFGLLIELLGLAIGFYFEEKVRRFLFGRDVAGSFPLWLNIVLGIAVVLYITIAIWDGIEVRKFNSTPSYQEPLSMRMFKNVKLPTTAQIEQIEQLQKQRLATSKP